MEDKSSDTAIKFRYFQFLLVLYKCSFAILNELLPIFDGEYGINYVISLLLSIIWNFTFNRKFTFKASNDVKKAMLLVLLFYLVFTPVSAILGTMAEARGTNEYIVLGITMLFNFVLEFLYSKYVVFKEM